MLKNITLEEIKSKVYLDGDTLRWKALGADSGLAASIRAQRNSKFADQPVKLHGLGQFPSIKINRQFISLARVVYALHFDKLVDYALFISRASDLSADNVKQLPAEAGAVFKAQDLIRRYEGSQFIRTTTALQVVNELINEINVLKAAL